MDNYENHDFVSAKKHATIILKYFDANDIQTLSTMANNIKESYDTWFGLRNIDRQEESFADTLEKYNKAKNYATETDEINKEIKRVLSVK
ncbi:MAG: hypothetical protein OEM18_04210 [Nitrosopumilus sp.]|nr:hypothetical protein [Nitrosopumilus sp.]MDH3502773.1 hypothetical protein [Nitrosopumilus sp.]